MQVYTSVRTKLDGKYLSAGGPHDLPDDMARYLIDRGEATPAGAVQNPDGSEEQVIEQPEIPEYDDITKNEIIAVLEDDGIDFSSGDSKRELYDLLVNTHHK